MRAVDHVVLGALLHDIGKLLERGGRFDKYRGDNDQQKIDCPWKKGTSGGPSNYHALFSRHFCEWLAEADNRRSLLPDGYNPKDGQADHWINLAARHHKRGRDSTDLQKIVYAADGLASGEREWIITGGFDNLFKTRLESILERVRLPRHLAGKPDSRETSHRLELAPFSPKKEAVFPRHFEAFEPSMEKRTGGRHPGALFSPVSLQEGYRELVSGMEESCGSLAFNPTSPSGFYSFVRDLLALLERFTSAVPSATNIRHPDISLFDHLRISAAIAEGVYHFHYDSDGNPKGPKHFNGRRKSKWRLVCADFSGIQSFIFNITAKGAAKGLRGRSLYISLQSDGMAEHLTRKLGLNPTTIIYSSGGRFYLLIPACKEEALREETAKINRYLLETFQGKVFLGLGIVEVCGDDFRGGNMGEKWQEASENLTADRHKKFMPLIVQDQRTFFTGLALNDRGEKCDCCGRIDEGVTIRKHGYPVASG